MLYIRLCVVTLCLFLTTTAFAGSVKSVFEHENQTRLIMHIEASLAEAQAKHGIIPEWAAKEIRSKVDPSLITEADLDASFAKVRHRMVAFLKVWSKKMDKGAEQYVHFGATTVDIYDSLMVLQLLDSIELLLKQQRLLEGRLISLVKEHASTVMIGRTLGQHALPITFGKKASSWLAENRRNIERLKTVQQKLRHSAILKGAVGSYLGLGEKGPMVEQDFAKQLGLDKPYPDDWHASRDTFAEYALTLAITSKSLARMGQDIFLMQGTDLAEVAEVRDNSVANSSSMPHKKNPNRSEALIQAGRAIPAQAEVVLDDMVNFFERDNTSGPNRVLVALSIAADKMLQDANVLLQRLTVYPDKMLVNLARTKGLITAQRVALALAPHIGKQRADVLIKKIAQQTYDGKQSFEQNLLADGTLQKYFSKSEISALADVSTYLGEDEALVKAVLDWVETKRQNDTHG